VLYNYVVEQNENTISFFNYINNLIDIAKMQ